MRYESRMQTNKPYVDHIFYVLLMSAEFGSILVSLKESAKGGTYDKLGSVPEFLRLQDELTACGLKACSAWQCLDPIKSQKTFSRLRNGEHPTCKPCDLMGFVHD